MPKASYIPWTSEEEETLEGWLSQYSHLSWNSRSEEYHKQFGRRRSPESLRGKRNQLQKGIRRHRLINGRHRVSRRTAVRRARFGRRQHWLDIPKPPPALKMMTPDPDARRLMQRFAGNQTPHEKTNNSCEL
ncbi:hypothetical protein N7523_010273 [Penicillium sp. IBT 18751x]|nr:hypothetical protein N7523_010220 [Penicillium sp. IBT 18751x]KAJ6105199.1 hypothetical protein N7523_010273 [Penicillium sp. IBT 18751x]